LPRGKKARSLADRLWSKVDKNGPIVRADLGPCWIWMGWREKRAGHGRIAKNGTAAGMMGAHVAAWIVTFGPVTNGNPSHLFTGTNADNMADMKAKGRQRSLCGEDNPISKLTAADVGQIRRRIAAGDRQVDIAADFGIIQAHVSRIKRGASWVSATKPPNPEREGIHHGNNTNESEAVGADQ
jgi:hypothetical protein